MKEQDRRMMQLPNGSVSHGDRRRKKSKTGEDRSSHTAQVGPRSRGSKKKYGMNCICI